MSYSVLTYSLEELIKLFAEKSNAPRNKVEEKIHIIFFQNYFNDLKAKTIVVEDDYVDHDYLEDYSNYYVKSFKPYNRFCIRLHFFSNSFDKETFKEVLISDNTNLNQEILQKNYLGFIVLKPLPQTYIGRTCLKTYPNDQKRFFPFSRPYDINLFGIKLSVNSIAFQEQDSVVAACASSAIWSAFHVTGKLFQHYIPTPVEITKSAIEIIPDSSRLFPNNGLTPEQMAQAVRNVGLDPYFVDNTNNDILKATVYAYQKAGIPLIMGMDLIEQNEETKNKGKHSVAVTGYSMTDKISKFNGKDFYLKSSRISKLYVHDDQVGPFARMEFNNTNNELTTSWTDSNSKIGNVIAKPDIIIVPLYPKIRIPFKYILRLINKLNEFAYLVTEGVGIKIGKIEWEIFLSKSNVFKNEIRNSLEITNVQKEEILLSRFPKYIWRTIGILDDEKIEFVFDSTDIEQGELFSMYISNDNDFLNLFKLIAHYIEISKVEQTPLACIFKTLKSDDFRNL